mgnify:CR=1 FL=1
MNHFVENVRITNQYFRLGKFVLYYKKSFISSTKCLFKFFNENSTSSIKNFHKQEYHIIHLKQLYVIDITHIFNLIDSFHSTNDTYSLLFKLYIRKNKFEIHYHLFLNKSKIIFFLFHQKQI